MVTRWTLTNRHARSNVRNFWPCNFQTGVGQVQSSPFVHCTATNEILTFDIKNKVCYSHLYIIV